MGLYIVVILGLATLMVVHECGHFLVARAFGMRVTRFSIGFGPTIFKIGPKDGYFWFTTLGERIRVRLWKHDAEKSGPTVYQVAMIPFLAYVQIAGMNPLEDVDKNDKGSYANASLPGRILTIFGGPFANYLFASILFFFSFWIGGKVLEDANGNAVVTNNILVLDDRPAIRAGLRDGDKIIAIDDTQITGFDGIAHLVESSEGHTLKIGVERQGSRVDFDVTPAKVEDPEKKTSSWKIGVEGLKARTPVKASEAAVLAIQSPPEVVRQLVKGIRDWVTHKVEGEFTGPIGIAKEGKNSARHGLPDYLWFLAALSAYLGAFNLIPFPALDGGRLMFLAYEATTRRRPNATVEAHIHAFGLLMMIGLMIWVNAKDISRLFSK